MSHHHEKHWLDRTRIFPRAIAAIITVTTCVLMFRVVGAVLEGGIVGAGELTALTALMTASLGAVTTILASLSKRES